MFKSFRDKLKGFFGKKEEEEEKKEKVEEAEGEKKEKKEEKPKKEEKVKETKEAEVEEPKPEVKITKKVEEIPEVEQAPAETLKEKIAKLPKKERKYPKKKPVDEEEEKKEEEKEEPKETLEEKREELTEENKTDLDYAIDELEEDVEEEIQEKQPEEQKKGFFSAFRKKVTSTQLTKELFDEFFENLEMLLIENNVALEVIDKIKEDMEKDLLDIQIKKSDIEEEIKKSLSNSIQNILLEPFDLIDKIKDKKEKEPFVILFFGINGSGKTTSIAKVTNLLKENKIPTVLAAADTFRAASIEQLKKHGDKLGVKVISQDYGSDPAAVGFDAIQHAKANGIKAVLIDTAGRMHTKSDLIREMEKIVKVTNPDLKIFVAESITGNDATEQAKAFNQAFGLDASILTKADVDEKGGTSVSIGHVTGKPILFLGTGQEYDNLEKFNPKEIIHNLGLD